MGSKQLESKFLKRSQICLHTPSALNAGAKRSEATCHMAMPQCCYLAKGAKRPSHTTNTIKFDRIPFDPCNSIKRFDLCPFDQKNSTYLQLPKNFEPSDHKIQPTPFELRKKMSTPGNIIMWGIGGVCTLTLTVPKTSSHYDRFAIFVPANPLLLFDLA